MPIDGAMSVICLKSRRAASIACGGSVQLSRTGFMKIRFEGVAQGTAGHPREGSQGAAIRQGDMYNC